MSSVAINVTLGGDLGEGRFNLSAGHGVDPVGANATQVALLATAKTNSTAIVSAAVAVAAAVAVLVADAASPTQAHVTTLNTAYGTLATAITTSNTSTQAVSLTVLTAALAADAVLIINQATVTTKNGLMFILRAILHRFPGWGIVT